MCLMKSIFYEHKNERKVLHKIIFGNSELVKYKIQQIISLTK